LRDKKIPFHVDAKYLSPRAQRKSPQGALIGGNISKAEVFADDGCKFAVAYGDQTQRDHNHFMKAGRSGKLPVKEG
jgi:hypothetical protein